MKDPLASVASGWPPTARRLRIAFVYDALYPHQKGGAERRIVELARRLAVRHEVHVVSWRHWEGPSETDEGAVQFHGVGTPPNLYGSDGKRTVREAVAFAARLVPAVLRGRYDVIDCPATPYIPLYACWAASRLTGTPLVATWHEFWGDHWEEYLAHRPTVARAARWAESAALHLGDRYVAVSAFTAHRLRDAGLTDERIRVVDNGVSVGAYRSAQRSPIRSDLIYVGRLIEDKRVDLLISAVARLSTVMPDLRCLIIGDGPERDRLEAQSAAEGTTERIRFLGQVEEADKIALLRASRIFVLPSVREGFGIAVVEAQAAGLAPVVVRGELTAASTLIRDRVDGLVCAPRVEDLTDTIRGLLGDPIRLRDIRAAATQAAERWDWDRVAIEMERIYLDAARPHPAEAGATDDVAEELSWR